MTLPDNFDEHVALLLPLYLHQTRDTLLKKARTQRPDLARAWPSLRQANWLGEVAARAVSVQDIDRHLKKQGGRWADEKARPRLHEAISQRVGDSLKRQVVDAMQTTAREVAKVRKMKQLPEYTPDDAWVSREQLTLARLYIGALVAWRRIDLRQEGQE